ncbi:MAG TPA: EAL domain-containing protein [Casimicrobiaceae bacterium]
MGSSSTDRRADFARGAIDDVMFATLFAEHPLPLWIYDRATLRFLTVNSAACRTYGYSREEFLRLSIADIRPREDIGKLRATIKRMAAGGPRSGVWRHCRKDGTTIWVEVFSHPIDVRGRPALFVCPMDITERVQAEEAQRQLTDRLQERERSLQYAQQMAKLAHVVTRSDGSLESWSDSLPSLLGLTERSMPKSARAWMERIDADDQRVFRALVIQAARTGKRMDAEYRMLRGDGTWIHLRHAVEPVASRRGARRRWFSTVQDVSERKAAELSIRRLNRVYAVLSGINALIVRVRDRPTLYQESCRIAIEVGGLQLAWFGVVDASARRIDVVASAGADRGFLERLPRDLGESGNGCRTLPAEVLEDGRAIVVDDLLDDARVVLADEVRARGLRSAALLPIRDACDVIGVFALYSSEVAFFDATEMRLLDELANDIGFTIGHITRDERLQYLARYDPLTGLWNRDAFREYIVQHVRLTPPDRGKAAIVVFDIVRFHTINNTLGQAAGDDLLRQIAARYRASTDETGMACRLVGDQFGMLLLNVASEDDVVKAIERHQARIFDAPFNLFGTEVRVAAKFGIAMYPADAADADSLLKDAESALYRAKTGVDRFLFYTQKMTDRITARLALENRLRRALERNELVLHYQPKVDVETRAITGVEALMRWNDPETGLVPPLEFVPTLEETGLILEAGAWALRQARADHRRWRRLKLRAPNIAVNVSAVQLHNVRFMEVLHDATAGRGNAAAIGIEITESMLMDNADETIAKLAEIRARGVQIMIDDFGTGYSSLAYLARVPAHALKIDRSFIAALATDPDTMTLVSTIVSLAHALRLKVVAEGVETEEQARILRLLKCDEMQGFLISRPLPEEELRPLLAA